MANTSPVVEDGQVTRQETKAKPDLRKLHKNNDNRRVSEDLQGRMDDSSNYAPAFILGSGLVGTGIGAVLDRKAKNIDDQAFYPGEHSDL